MPSAGAAPRLFAATDDSKKPRSAMTKDVLNAASTCLRLEKLKGFAMGNGRPLAERTSPRMARPCLSQRSCQESSVAMTTMRKRSGKYAADG